MKPDKTSWTIDQVLDMQPAQTQDWFKEVCENHEYSLEKFNWLGLAEGAALKARIGSDYKQPVPNIEWAVVAILIYAWLSKEYSKKRLADQSEACQLSAMMLRADLIRKLGCIPNHVVLDLNQIVDWFFSNLSFSVEKAEKLIGIWRDEGIHKITVHDLIGLRQIKNRLGVIKFLIDEKCLSASEELNKWVLLKDKLP